MEGSYYDAFGETVDIEESLSGDSAMSSGQTRGRRWSRPGSAATGGISSGSASGEGRGVEKLGGILRRPGRGRDFQGFFGGFGWRGRRRPGEDRG